ncbi:MAG: EutN/CcmL family microcompartment protein [Gemmatimonadetes bacterium]|nr:EutN/CcmL family microcompartment protein [Gemmatimonadota bacterium]
MNLARIIGRVVVTVKSPGLGTATLQWVEPVDRFGRPRGKPLVALDTIGSGPGELVFYVTAREATIPLVHRMVPVDASIIGFVDRLRLEEES